MTLDQLPNLPLVLEPSGTLRLFKPREDVVSLLGDEYNEVTLQARTVLTRNSPGGELNTPATLLTGHPVFGAVVLFPPNDA